jgi:RimJ/RimL family protein N-acetyltransferase
MTLAIPTRETDRLILRAWRAQDLRPFAEICADAELMRWVGRVMDAPAAWRRMSAYAGNFLLLGYGTFALEDRASNDLAGFCGVYDPADCGRAMGVFRHVGSEAGP